MPVGLIYNLKKSSNPKVQALIFLCVTKNEP